MANLDYSSIDAKNAAEALFSGGAAIVSASLIGSNGDANKVAAFSNGDAVNFTMTFASEEYPEYVGSIYNDMAAVYVNDELVPITGTKSGIVDVNAGGFYNNTDSSINTGFDGVLISLSVTAKLIPG